MEAGPTPNTKKTHRRPLCQKQAKAEEKKWGGEKRRQASQIRNLTHKPKQKQEKPTSQQSRT